VTFEIKVLDKVVRGQVIGLRLRQTMVETRYCLDLVVLDKMCQGCKVINFLQHKS